MAPKIGDNPLRQHRQKTEKEERIETVTIRFLSSFKSQITNSLPLFQSFSVVLFETFSNHGVVQDLSLTEHNLKY